MKKNLPIEICRSTYCGNCLWIREQPKLSLNELCVIKQAQELSCQHWLTWRRRWSRTWWTWWTCSPEPRLHNSACRWAETTCRPSWKFKETKTIVVLLVIIHHDTLYVSLDTSALNKRVLKLGAKVLIGFALLNFMYVYLFICLCFAVFCWFYVFHLIIKY